MPDNDDLTTRLVVPEEKAAVLAYLAALPCPDLHAVQAVVASAQAFGDGWLAREHDGSLRPRPVTVVVRPPTP